jgi:hypothetical protein
MAARHLQVESPKRSIGFDQFETNVPSLMVTPDHLGFRPAATDRMNQPYAAMQGQRRSDNRHATRVADIYGHGIGTLFGRILVPLDDQFHLGKDAFVAS